MSLIFIPELHVKTIFEANQHAASVVGIDVNGSSISLPAMIFQTLPSQTGKNITARHPQ